MRLGNTTTNQDRILSKGEEAGGIAEECAMVAQDIDDQLSGALNRIKELEDERDNNERPST